MPREIEIVFTDSGVIGRVEASGGGVGVVGDEEARSLALIAVGQQLLVIGMDMADMAAERKPERGRGRGHRVFTPTLTGLGERSHLMSPSIDL